MLTVDYDRLGLRAGDLLLDLGCGYGRHAYEAFRRGARVVACDMSQPELKDVKALLDEMRRAGEVAPTAEGDAVCGDATRLPFPDESVDRIIASEVMEHIPDDEAALDELYRVLKPGGSLAVTIPAWFPERVCWALSDEYYAPKSVGGHVRIYTEVELRGKLRAAGLRPGGSHHAHALHTPYWWLRCTVGPRNDDFPLVRWYHKLLVWDIEKHPLVLRTTESMLNPVLGKSLVVYATKPLHARIPTREAAHVGA
ncbi:MAG: class I SAM-dependent methyltransferase [Acidimicrobiales bacterium]|nr:class I SAM-dependent methyltransferase [Acidimicrobiales bacterium]